jgi:hypothetical protein
MKKRNTALLVTGFIVLAIIELFLLYSIFIFDKYANSEAYLILLFSNIVLINRLFFNFKEKKIYIMMRYASEILFLISLYLFFLNSANDFDIIQILMSPSMIVQSYGTFLAFFGNMSRNKETKQ